MFEYRYETRYGDYRDFDTIKIGSLIDIIQDVSTKSSENCGYGINKLRDMHLAWLLKGFNIHIESKVLTGCPVDAHTAVKTPRGATSNRGCVLYQNGELKLKSIADWFLFDTDKKRPVRIPPEMLKIYDTCDFDDDFFTYRKPVLIKAAPDMYRIRIANKDIDTNMHLNNQRGADLLMDALPYDFDFNNIKILYKKPSFLGEELTICSEGIENGYYVHLKDDADEIHIAACFEAL